MKELFVEIVKSLKEIILILIKELVSLKTWLKTPK